MNKFIGSHIEKALIKAHGHIAINQSSSDCDSIIIITSSGIMLFRHAKPYEYGIALEFPRTIHPDYNIEVDLSSRDYCLEKFILNENNRLDTIVFKSEKDYLFVFSSDHELIVTKSIIDLSAEIYFEDIPDVDPSILLVYRED